jgi:hypothetical protein
MWTALDSRNAVLVQSASCKLDKNGSFSIELTLPATVNTGFGRISFIHEDNKNSFEHVFSVQEVRENLLNLLVVWLGPKSNPFVKKIVS